MGFFKEGVCANCGGKAGVLSRYKLSDGKYICINCAIQFPGEVLSKLSKCDWDDYQRLEAFIKEENQKNEAIFEENCTYKPIHADTTHGIYYIEGMKPRLYLKMAELYKFDLEFIADEVKEGFLRDKAIGKVHLSMESNFPAFVIDKDVASRVKAEAIVKDGLFRKTATYYNPKGMDEFLTAFVSAWRYEVDAKFEALRRELIEENYGGIFDHLQDEYL